jgi:hypothetical protein
MSACQSMTRSESKIWSAVTRPASVARCDDDVGVRDTLGVCVLRVRPAEQVEQLLASVRVCAVEPDESRHFVVNEAVRFQQLSSLVFRHHEKLRSLTRSSAAALTDAGAAM